jgi:energy-coupling factor transport system permease protein
VKNNPFSSAKTNPATWWILGICLAVQSALTTSWLVLFIISISTLLIVFLCRDESSWSRSIKFYLLLAMAIIIIRVLFRVIFNLEQAPLNPLFVLPSLEISLGFGSNLKLFGAISSQSFFAAVTDGLRLATIILAMGMANSLANPRKLLRQTPGALYEIATAISIAINLAPQLISSLNRVRGARRLRGQSRGLKALPGLVIPVLEDTIDQSMSLAASMSARGFGRRGENSNIRLVATRLTGLSATTLLAIGATLILISPQNQLLDFSLLVAGLIASVIYIKLSALGATRTRYSRAGWRFPDFLVILSGFSLLALSFSGVIS